MWETLRKEEIFKLLKTDRRSGITKEQVIERRQKYGGNKLEDKPKETMFIKFIKQFNDFMIIILILASIVSAGISYIQGENDYIDSIIIIAIVILLGCLSFDYIQKYFVTKKASEFVNNYDGEITTGNQNITEENTVTNTIIENVTDIFNETPSGTTNTISGNKSKWNGFTVLGTMKIPAINFEYPILQEISSSAISNAVSLLWPDGESLNQPGNVVIVGHNYRNGLFFSNLKKLSNGDKIYIKDYRGVSITYTVYNKFEAAENDTSFYARDTNGKAEVTLSTCTDASNDQRTIVFARQD